MKFSTESVVTQTAQPQNPIPFIALALLIGAAGGATFFALNLPLPWMLGAMIACFIAVLAKLPLRAPARLRPFVIPVIGVMLGSGFDTQTFGHMLEWGFSLLGLLAYLGLSAAIVIPFFVKFGRMDPVTAFFSGMPGGLSEMMIIGGEMGGDENRIVLSHAARIFATVTLIAIYFRVILGYQVSGVAAPNGAHAVLEVQSGVLLLACAVIGTILGHRLKLPAAGLLGPMILSAAVHMTGLSQAAPPRTLVIIAQIVMGSMIGCRFMGADPRLIIKTLILSICATSTMLGLSLVFANGLSALLGTSVEQTLLAYAPGGLTEMSLVAIAMNAEVAFISIHHLIRIVILIAVAPGILKWLMRKLSL